MEALMALNISPLNAPHKELEWFPLANRDFQIKDTATPTLLLKLHYWSKDRFLNHTDDINLWESNLPK